jgi:predicted dehydrogenase
MNRKLRMGMVGGGTDAFIGAIHRLAALMDNKIELVCGCFSVNPEISKESGKLYFLPENRVYETYQEMFEKEALLPEGERMDFVSIVTPNFVHFAPAMMALENGFHVVLDKPITFTLDEALQLKEKVEETGLTLALTHTYSGYPAVKHAKKMVADGELGKIRKILLNILRVGCRQNLKIQEMRRHRGEPTQNVQEKQAVWAILEPMPIIWLNTLPV